MEKLVKHFKGYFSNNKSDNPILNILSRKSGIQCGIGLPPEMGKGLVGFRHLVRVFALFHGVALVI